VPMACMLDADGDDWGDQMPPPGVTGGTDCDDASATTHPGAAEIEAPFNCMRDDDDDGYGDIAASLPIVPGTDCDDALPLVNPGATEGPPGDPTCTDTFDNDCDLAVDAADADCSTVRPQGRSRPPRAGRPLLRPGASGRRGR